MRCVIILSCIFISSCATPYKTVLNRYYEATVCCREFKEFQYEKLYIPDSKSFMIDENSQAFIFDTGKSYFKAFELPEYTVPYTITIKSYMLGDHIKSAYIFCPAVMFLDERLSIIRFIENDVFQYKKTAPFETSGLGAMFEAEIPVTQEGAHERYMIILTTDKLLGEKIAKTVPVFVPFIFPGVVGVLPTGKQEMVYIPYSPIGRLNILIRKLEE